MRERWGFESGEVRYQLKIQNVELKLSDKPTTFPRATERKVIQILRVYACSLAPWDSKKQVAEDVQEFAMLSRPRHLLLLDWGSNLGTRHLQEHKIVI
jgi:hypothetical protein